MWMTFGLGHPTLELGHPNLDDLATFILQFGWPNSFWSIKIWFWLVAFPNLDDPWWPDNPEVIKGSSRFVRSSKWLEKHTIIWMTFGWPDEKCGWPAGWLVIQRSSRGHPEVIKGSSKGHPNTFLDDPWRPGWTILDDPLMTSGHPRFRPMQFLVLHSLT